MRCALRGSGASCHVCVHLVAYRMKLFSEMFFCRKTETRWRCCFICAFYQSSIWRHHSPRMTSFNKRMTSAAVDALTKCWVSWWRQFHRYRRRSLSYRVMFLNWKLPVNNKVKVIP